MATGQTQAPPSARRAQMMREAWRPVRQRLGRDATGVWGYLTTHPSVTQGVYYILTGVWPWLHMTSFLWVTGDKTDLWLVQTVGALITVIGIILCLAAYLREYSWAILCLAVGSALALTFVDVLFVSQQRIPPIYLLDAVLEVGILGLWLYAWRRGSFQVARPVPVATATLAPAGPAVPGQTVPAGQPGLAGSTPRAGTYPNVSTGQQVP